MDYDSKRFEGMRYDSDLQTLEYKCAPEDIGVGSLGADMIATAENLAVRYDISREECDAFAITSHMKAAAAWEQGCFADQVFPVTVPQRKGTPRS